MKSIFNTIQKMYNDELYTYDYVKDTDSSNEIEMLLNNHRVSWC